MSGIEIAAGFVLGVSQAMAASLIFAAWKVEGMTAVGAVGGAGWFIFGMSALAVIAGA